MDTDTTTEDLLNDLRRWVSADALKIDNIEKYDLKIYGANDKGENYGSDIAFVDISAENFNGDRREYNLVIKYGIKNNDIRENVPIRLAFEREVDIYNKIMPCYQKFQQEKNLPVFSSAPKCFVTKLTETEEVIVLENLKQLGYKMHNRKVTMDIDHIKLVLQAYAEWHALSFALKDQRAEEILEVTKTWTTNPFSEFILTEKCKEILNKGQQYLYEILTEMGEMELLRRYKEKIESKEAQDVILKLLNQEESQSVVLHADCWNNNFLFKYEDKLTKPLCNKVAILDFQLSYVHSPAIDLSCFIYAVASNKELKHFKELLHHYYNYFENYLTALGSDPKHLFPFSDLIQHLKKYSLYGAMMNPMEILFTLVEKENVSDFGKDKGMDMLQAVAKTQEFRNRVLGVARHFVEYEF